MKHVDVSDFIDGHSPTELVVFALIGLVLAAAFGALAFKLPKSLLLGILLSAAILQGFKPLGYISIALLLPLVMAPAIIKSTQRSHWNGWVKVALAILIWQAVSMLWAVKVGAVAHAAASTLALLLSYLLARQVAATPHGISRALRIASPFVLLEAAFTIVFRWMPALESVYFSSPVALFLSEPNVALMASNPQNVSDPAKAAGFLLNGNIASLLLLLIACLYAHAYARNRDRFFAFVSVVAIAGCLATGSKTALVLLFLLPALVLVLNYLLRGSRIAFALLGGLTVAFIGAVAVLAAVGSPLITTAVISVGDRGRLWSLAGSAFLEHPMLGLGYGGWVDYLREHKETVFEAGRAFQEFPAHNFIIQAWADAGIPLAVLVTVIAVLPVVQGVRRLGVLRSNPLFGRENLQASVLVIALVWLFIHSLADTTGFFGENHTLPFLATVAALLHAGTRNDSAEAVTRDRSEARAPSGEAPSIQRGPDS